ncbi:MBL fold metallo-hydrolase [Enterococcus asini]|uniref:MBL fold metallo-hydrolase n=1 Tax=Enterococcus asini TaxID=57732 RepID=UPI0022E4F3C6|nr:MBL fold metallo-hydrolase [Enterococcus asini]
MIKIKSFGSGSSGNGYVIDDGYTQLMIECGVPFRKIQREMGHDFSRVAGLLISHEHRDHCKSIKPLIEGTVVEIFTTAGTRKAMLDDQALKLGPLDRYRFNTLKYRITTQIGTWFVTPFEVQHDVQEPCGFLIDNIAGDRLVFITDSYYSRYQFPNVTHIMVEANYSKDIIDETMTSGFDLKRKTRLLESHFDFGRTLEFLQANKSQRLKEVWLLHLSDSNSNEREFKEETQRLTGVPVFLA